jgi:hypothetical protein
VQLNQEIVHDFLAENGVASVRWMPLDESPHPLSQS